MNRDPALEKKLTEAALRWPRGKPGLQDEIARITREHEEWGIAWRKLGPLVALLIFGAIILILMASRRL